jgi:transcriptional regulator with XRE-family HTH domain/Zn-dependent peptidase ImmA (M78 family)
MIKNERQYRITKAQALQFADALRDLEKGPRADIHPILAKAQVDAARSQYADLQAEILEYESLQRERPSVIEASTLDDLPRALIRARIALGFSQKDLAEKMGLKEQQLQRYEATEYSAASLTRLQEVAQALGVRVSERIFLPVHEPTKDALYARLDGVGIDTGFLLSRLLPADIVTALEDEKGAAETRSVARASRILNKIFKWEPSELYGTAPLGFKDTAVATARFKIPGGPHGRRLQAYIVYAHYLAMVVANACRNVPKTNLTFDAAAFRQDLLSKTTEFNLKTVLHYFWDCGVPVLPLNDTGIFHGASWRIDGRNVIVLKQRSRFLSRWVFDLLHEWHHAAQSPNEATHSWIEESDLTSVRRNSPEERAANGFAGNVLLDGRAEELVGECVRVAQGNIPHLKSVVRQVAESGGVSVDHLANYLAWRLSLQGENWWGTANNLQTQVGDPFSVAADVFYERFNFGDVDPIDASLLARALSRDGDYR